MLPQKPLAGRIAGFFIPAPKITTQPPREIRRLYIYHSLQRNPAHLGKPSPDHKWLCHTGP